MSRRLDRYAGDRGPVRSLARGIAPSLLWVGLGARHAVQLQLRLAQALVELVQRVDGLLARGIRQVCQALVVKIQVAVLVVVVQEGRDDAHQAGVQLDQRLRKACMRDRYTTGDQRLLSRNNPFAEREVDLPSPRAKLSPFSP